MTAVTRPAVFQAGASSGVVPGILAQARQRKLNNRIERDFGLAEPLRSAASPKRSIRDVRGN
jgi:hypothetical protein